MTHFRSGCPIASALDIVGDRWTLVILRSMAIGAKSFSDLARQPERIASNILSDRLARMEAAGLITADRPKRGSIRGAYAITPKGAELLPVIQSLARWGERHIADRWHPPASFYAMTPADLV